jgi:hypothetical protein
VPRAPFIPFSLDIHVMRTTMREFFFGNDFRIICSSHS